MNLQYVRLAVTDLVTITRLSFDNFAVHECGQRAAALAYYAFFSIFPLLLMMISIMGFLLEAGWPAATNAQATVLDAVEKITPDARSLLARSIDAARTARGGTGILSLLMLAWTASNIFAHASLAFDTIWGKQIPRKLRAVIRWRLDALSMVLGTGLLLIAYTLFDTFIDLILRYAIQLPGSRYWLHIGISLASTFVTALLFGLLYRIIPRAVPSWLDIWPGALVASVAWEILKWAFSLYTTSLANWGAIYGPIAGVIVLLLWLYLSAHIILFGAEFSAAYAQLRQTKTEPSAQSQEA
jgi:membrane protein